MSNTGIGLLFIEKLLDLNKKALCIVCPSRELMLRGKLRTVRWPSLPLGMRTAGFPKWRSQSGDPERLLGFAPAGSPPWERAHVLSSVQVATVLLCPVFPLACFLAAPFPRSARRFSSGRHLHHWLHFTLPLKRNTGNPSRTQKHVCVYARYKERAYNRTPRHLHRSLRWMFPRPPCSWEPRLLTARGSCSPECV